MASIRTVKFGLAIHLMRLAALAFDISKSCGGGDFFWAFLVCGEAGPLSSDGDVKVLAGLVELVEFVEAVRAGIRITPAPSTTSRATILNPGLRTVDLDIDGFTDGCVICFIPDLF